MCGQLTIWPVLACRGFPLRAKRTQWVTQAEAFRRNGGHVNNRQVDRTTKEPEIYLAPQLEELGTLVELTASGHYTLLSGGDLPVISSVTG
jgi:hypothetical protein